MNYITKQTGSVFTISALLLAGIVNAQNIETGLKYLDNDQSEKAKKVFEDLISQSPTADNYYYLGYYYLKTNEIEKASQSFNKGLEADPKSNLNKIGLATIKLYQKDQKGANEDFAAIASSTKYKNAEVLYQIANAYVLFDNPEQFNPDQSIRYAEKLLELVKQKDKPEYYIVLGNAYYQKNDPGRAIQQYGKARDISDNKAPTLVLIGKVLGRSTNENNQKNAEKNFNDAIAADPNYSISYKYLSDLQIRSHNYEGALKNYQKYIEVSGNKNPETQINLAQIAYYSKDFDKSLSILDQSWNSITDPIKYKMKAAALVEKSEFEGAYENMKEYMEKESRIYGGDYGILGMIQSKLLTSKEGKEKEELTKEAVANLTKAQSEGDKTYNYQMLLLSLNSSTTGTTQTNPTIEKLKTAVTANPNDTKSWYELALEQYTLNDYVGSINSWDNLIALIPDWETSYAGKAMAVYALNPKDETGIASQLFQKYIDMVAPKTEYNNAEKAYLTISYTFFAYKSFQDGNKEKTQEYIDKTLAIDPQNADVLNLQKKLN